jgi:hypothetical protein
MSISNLEEKDITDEILLNYINGKGSDFQMKQITELLKTSKTIFFRYMAIKETLFLEKMGSPPTKEREEELLKSILHKTKSIPHILIRILMGKEKIAITSSDQENLEYRGIMADFAWRGSSAGPLTIVRNMEGYEVTIQLVPGERKEEYNLSVQINPSKNISCELFISNSLIEEINEMKKPNFFENPISSKENSELRFRNKKEALFTIGIFLQTE